MRVGKLQLRFILAAILLSFFCSNPVMAQVVVEHAGGVAIVSGGEDVETSLNMVNTGEDAVHFRTTLRSGGPRNRAERAEFRRDDRGGPDDFQMEWRDSNEDDGPIYEWIDITGFRDVVDIQNLVDDRFYGFFDLGFEFPFYGEVYDQIGCHSNGFACFVDASPIVFFWPAWGELPNANPGAADQTPPPTLLAVNYQDLNPDPNGGGGHIYFWTDASMAVISWVNVDHFGFHGEAPWTFQLIITPDGLVEYQYANVGRYDDAHDMLIGLQNENRDRGFTVALDNVNYIEAEKAVAFGPPAAWFDWIDLEPRAGDLEAGGDVDLALTFLPGDFEDGYYWANLLIYFDNDQSRISIPLVMSLNSPVGEIAGTVTDAATHRPIEGALAKLTDVGSSTYTNAEGGYSFTNLPPRVYSLYISAEDFNDYNFGDIEVNADETADGSAEMLHGEFTPDHNEITAQVPPGERTQVNFTVANGGNDFVHYTSDRRLIGAANTPPWELRQTTNISQILNDQRIEGVGYLNGHYYVAGAAGADPNTIYVLNDDFEEVNRFDQAGHSNYGYKDLEWDGEWFWGSGEDTIYAFTPDGEVMRRFRGPHRPTSVIAWDPVREVLWVAGTTTDLVPIDRDGNRVGDPLRRLGLRPYGLAYFPEDPDGYYLYLMTQPGNDLPMMLYRMNPANGDTARVAGFQGQQGAASGIFITSELDIYSWVMLVIAANADGGNEKLHTVQIAGRRDWMMINPEQGVINPDSEVEFTVSFNAEGLPPERFEGEIVFTHDARGGEFHLPITLDVVEGPVHAIRGYPLAFGWNMISANLQPDEGDVTVLLSGLVQQGLVEMMKDGFGHFYFPARGFNNIPDWSVEQGYSVKARGAGVLSLEGTTVVAEEPIELHQGWQITAFYPRRRMNADVGFATIMNHLIIAKNGSGQFMLPRWEFNNMAPLCEGQGYQLRLDADAELVYPINPGRNAVFVEVNPEHYAPPTPTGSNMSVLLLDAPDGEYAVFADQIMVGAGVASNGRCGIAVWGDDASTTEVEGAAESQELQVRCWDGRTERPAAVEALEGESRFSADAIFIGRVTETGVIPTSLTITSVHPNPFNSISVVRYALPETEGVKLTLFDASGRTVKVVDCGVREAGAHAAVLDGSNLTSGLYILRLQAGRNSTSVKIMMLK